jgi:hypothetical protein
MSRSKPTSNAFEQSAIAALVGEQYREVASRLDDAGEYLGEAVETLERASNAVVDAIAAVPPNSPLLSELRALSNLLSDIATEPASALDVFHDFCRRNSGHIIAL